MGVALLVRFLLSRRLAKALSFDSCRLAFNIQSVKPGEAQGCCPAVSVLLPCSDQGKSLSQSGFKTDKSTPSLDVLHKDLADGPKLPFSEKLVHKADPGWCLGS